MDAEKMYHNFKMALGLSGINIDLKTAELIHRVCHKVDAMGGDYDIKTHSEIEALVEANHPEKKAATKKAPRK